MLILCTTCQHHYQQNNTGCPHCQAQSVPSVSKTTPVSVALLLGLGLGLSACGDKPEDTGSTDTSDTEDTQVEPSTEVMYGVVEQ